MCIVYIMYKYMQLQQQQTMADSMRALNLASKASRWFGTAFGCIGNNQMIAQMLMKLPNVCHQRDDAHSIECKSSDR